MKVLIVSSYKVTCGIAAYTESLETLLVKDFDVTVAPLDQAILKSRVPHVVKAGDQQIKDLCARFKEFDVVNFQWEPGILGDTPHDMARRLGWIVEAPDNLILTVHTVVPYPSEIDPWVYAGLVRRNGVLRSLGYLFSRERRYQRETYRILQDREKSGKNTYVAVHTEREKQFFRDVVGCRNVFDHPLSLVHADWPARLKQDTPDARRRLQDVFPDRKKFIGVFGFLSEYKGILTALRAMKLLDKDYQLLIYGGVHPATVKDREPVNAYVMKLMDEMESDALRAKVPTGGPPRASSAELADDLAADAKPSKHATGRGPDAAERDTATEAEQDGTEITDDVYTSRSNATRREQRGSNSETAATLMEKVAFLGSPDDYEFALAMNAVDICVFPYLEVGQSGSGPVSIAVELGKPAIVSRTKAFIEFARYYPKNVEMVDIGNHIQLAQSIMRLSRHAPELPAVHYGRESLSAFYGKMIRELARGRSSAEVVRLGGERAA